VSAPSVRRGSTPASPALVAKTAAQRMTREGGGVEASGGDRAFDYTSHSLVRQPLADCWQDAVPDDHAAEDGALGKPAASSHLQPRRTGRRPLPCGMPSTWPAPS